MKRILPEVGLGAETFEVIIDINNISISEAEIKIMLGYQSNQTPEHFGDIIKSVLTELRDKIQVRAGYRLVGSKIQLDDKCGLTIGEKYFNLQKIVTGALKKSETIAVFCLTIGPGMELRSKELLKNNELVSGYVYDLAASAAVEACADLLHNHLTEKMLQSNLKATNRYSPGYCNWSVEEQHLLFSLLPKNFCGINLTETALMIPLKSISGIIGIGEKVKYSEYSCNDCGVKDCTYRMISNLKLNMLNTG